MAFTDAKTAEHTGMIEQWPWARRRPLHSQPKMKALAALAFACTSLGLLANPVFIGDGPDRMVGETVTVRLLSDTGEVSGSYAFEPYWWGERPRTLYVPVFAADSDDPVKTFEQTKMEVYVNGYPSQLPMPCDPPKEFEPPAVAPKIVWFSTSLAFLIDGDIPPEHPTIQVRYSQPLIEGKFYYLPIITGADPVARKADPLFIMRIHSSKGLPLLLSESTEFERRDDHLVLYLKNQELVIAQ